MGADPHGDNMQDLIAILTNAEEQLRAASREAFKLSATRAAVGQTQEATFAAHAGMNLGQLADDIMRAKSGLQDALKENEVFGAPGRVRPIGPWRPVVVG